MTIGKRLRAERRRATDMNEGEFAEACGVHRNTQTRYEHDGRSVSVDYLLKARELGVDIFYVITGERK